MNNLKAERTLTAELIAAAQNVYDKLASETATVTIFDQERLGDALRSQSLSTQQPMGEVRVKPLEWRDQGNYTQVDTIIGRYSVQHDGDEPEEWSWCLATNRRYFCGSFEGAKAAAEADYCHRVLSALHPNQESGE